MTPKQTILLVFLPFLLLVAVVPLTARLPRNEAIYEEAPKLPTERNLSLQEWQEIQPILMREYPSIEDIEELKRSNAQLLKLLEK